MKKFFILIIVILVFLKPITSQVSPFEKVTKQYSLALEYTNNLTSTYDNIATNGFGIEFDYAWKLSGYHKKKNVFISIPLGFKVFSSSSSKDVKVLSYGWSVRHELLKNKNWTPFASYGLLLNQTWFDSIEGNNMGHQTRFTFGVNKKLNNKMFITFYINYSLIRIPSLNKTKADKFTRISINSGIRFG